VRRGRRLDKEASIRLGHLLPGDGVETGHLHESAHGGGGCSRAALAQALVTGRTTRLASWLGHLTHNVRGGGGMARGRGLGCARWQVGWGAGHTSKRAGQAAVAGERLGAR
jgi:hypothetical protein